MWHGTAPFYARRAVKSSSQLVTTRRCAGQTALFSGAMSPLHGDTYSSLAERRKSLCFGWHSRCVKIGNLQASVSRAESLHDNPMSSLAGRRKDLCFGRCSRGVGAEQSGDSYRRERGYRAGDCTGTRKVSVSVSAIHSCARDSRKVVSRFEVCWRLSTAIDLMCAEGWDPHLIWCVLMTENSRDAHGCDQRHRAENVIN